MKAILLFFLMSVVTLVQAQHTITGKVTDKNNKPVTGANVYLHDTYNGATTDAEGKFTFTTGESGKQTLIISFLSFETAKIEMEVTQIKDLHIRLRDDVTALDAVVLSAGTFSAGDNSKVSVLKPLDVVTTAGAAGDFIAALQTLPGTQSVGEDGRLFVRGGTAEETGIYIDGLRVFQPYTASANNLPSRGRYSPFLFDGITFSTGGYSAEFGEALSGVLLLNTINEPSESETNISLMTVGAGLGHTQKWEKYSLSLSTSYTNLAPYLEMVPNNEQANFTKPYETSGGELVFRKHFPAGIFKWYASFEHTGFEVLQPHINKPSPELFKLKNDNLYTNISYKTALHNGWGFYSGLSASLSRNRFTISALEVDDYEMATHLKMKISKRYSNRFKLDFGGEYVFKDFFEEVNHSHQNSVQSMLTAGFAEADIIFSKSLAMKPGVRINYFHLQEQFHFSPRLALALKAGKNGQFSLAYGDYLQQPDIDLLKYDPAIKPEEASHSILNYQWTRPGYTLRAEAYYKDYRKLIKYNTSNPQFESLFSNSGNGYARGVDLFYRDDKTFNSLQYWISYSFIESKRNFRNYPEPATPQFVPKHTGSIVTKYWIENWQSQVGFTFNFASGRPFQNPNLPGFMNDRTPNYGSLSFNWAYLLSRQKILYFSVSNITGRKNVFNYEYTSTPNSSGYYNRRPIEPAADRFFFIGFFWTLSADKNANQLQTL